MANGAKTAGVVLKGGTWGSGLSWADKTSARTFITKQQESATHRMCLQGHHKALAPENTSANTCHCSSPPSSQVCNFHHQNFLYFFVYKTKREHCFLKAVLSKICNYTTSLTLNSWPQVLVNSVILWSLSLKNHFSTLRNETFTLFSFFFKPFFTLSSPQFHFELMATLLLDMTDIDSEPWPGLSHVSIVKAPVHSALCLLIVLLLSKASPPSLASSAPSYFSPTITSSLFWINFPFIWTIPILHAHYSPKLRWLLPKSSATFIVPRALIAILQDFWAE